MNPVSTTPRGRAFVRTLVCRALGHVGPDARGFALDRWGSAAAEVVTKSTVTALLAQHDPEAQEFFAPVLERSLLGRLSGLRRVPFNVRMLSMQGGTRGYWTSPGAPRPISKPAMAGAWRPRHHHHRRASILGIRRRMWHCTISRNSWWWQRSSRGSPTWC